jgi:hypothetical protein
MKTKKCKNCNQIKSISEFHIRKQIKDGYNNKCKKCACALVKKYSNSPEQKEKAKIRKKIYNSSKNGKKINKKQRRKTYLNNKDKENARSRKWNQDNKETHRIYKNKYSKEYYRKNKTKLICRSMLHRALKCLGTKKSASTNKMLGYSPEQLKQRIESQFILGMTWDNYGKWHIDHKKPLSKFSKNTPIYIVNALSNLQPLWSIDNLKKHNKL